MIEDNKLIAEFMDIDQVDVDTWEDTEGDLKYHTSWDWLMPVVEKIRSIPSYDRDKFGTTVNICGNYTQIKSGSYGDKRHSKQFFNRKVVAEGFYDTKLNTYKAVVEFIKWYNENKK